ncbi:MAG: hypothetical protein C5B59_03590 [Bacteroidetes bacterium]|nr:MAG: hypothetical protein C5B59_03590 [Bacteroidota bacterium]
MKLQLIFLALVLISSPLVWQLPNYWRPKIMMLTTLVVLGWFAPLSVLIMLLVAFLQWLIWKNNYFRFRKLGVFLTIVLPILPLFVYKAGYKVNHWIIPLGLSYYAFRQVHVAFECYKSGMKKPAFLEYLEYLLFLPVMLIGPIHRMPEFQRSLRRYKWDPYMFSEGLERLLYGLVKINFLGNFIFAAKLTQLAAQADSNLLKIYLQTVSFTGNAYFQFAGFSDLAIGMGLVWGIRVMENFNSPFLATNMQDFWQRWHISLSSWCRDYVFYPLAALSRQRWFALIASMLVLALWHEISIRYVLWGALQALLILVTVRTRKAMPAFSQFINHHPFGKWFGRIWVFHAFAFSCILIGTENIPAVSIEFRQLFS